MEPQKPHVHALLAMRLLHSILPVAAASFYLAASFAATLYPFKEPPRPNQARGSFRIPIGSMMLGIFATYVGDAVVLISTSFAKESSPQQQDSILFALASALLWFTALLGYTDSQLSVSCPYYGCWLIYLVAEIVLLSLSLALDLPQGDLNIVELVLQALRLLLLIGLFVLAFGTRVLKNKKNEVDEENTPLLSQNAPAPRSLGTVQTARDGVAYGSCGTPGRSAASSRGESPNGANAKKGPAMGGGGALWTCIKSFRTLLPFFWPSDKPGLQLLYVGIAFCLAAERIMNIIVPLQIGLITNLLSQPNGVLPWKEIVVFIALRLLDSSGGIPAIIRFMWIPLEDFSYLKLSTAAFNQIMTLSSDFHDGKHSGKLWQTVVRGQSVRDIVNAVFFHVGPMIVDLSLAVSVLYYLFDAYMALVVGAISVMFIWSSNKILSTQRDKRRQWIENRAQEFTILCESTGNWQTVSYFNRVPHEKSRYSEAVRKHLNSRIMFRIWAYMENTIQSFLLTLGLLVACFIAAYQVAKGNKPVGSFIMLLSYWAQLSGPLQYIATGFGELALDMVDVEEFLDLLQQKPSISDPVGAKSMVLDRGGIEFVNVNFSYDGQRQVLKNICFRAPPGQTTALVGQTGGGKSTILKLIPRFYDPVNGVVKIDGQNISEVSLESLRANIGVVPQDPALFHDTIMSNIRYARLDASDGEIIEACKAVALHERFLSFTDGYNTLVGERGVKLSGGELQRVAIARAIIKKPKIVLLDEATSSVDSETEAQVQESLRMLTAGRTTIVIAHRLSTIIRADLIIVVNDGEIVEHGTHSELLNEEGHYHRLWSRQGFFNTQESGDQRSSILLDGLDSNQLVAKNGLVDLAVDRHEVDHNQMNGGCDVINGDQGQIPSPEPVVQILPSTKGDVQEKTGSPSKIWKPDAPEFIPRSRPRSNPTTLQTWVTQIGGDSDSLTQPRLEQVFNASCGQTAEPFETQIEGALGEHPADQTRSQKDALKSQPTCENSGKGEQTPVPNLKSAPEAVSSRITNTHRLQTPQKDMIFSKAGASTPGDTPRGSRQKRARVLRRRMSKSEPRKPRETGGDCAYGPTSTSTESEAVARQIPLQTGDLAIVDQRRRRRNHNWQLKGVRSNALSSTDGMESVCEQYHEQHGRLAKAGK